jgi:hypothetical protein
MRCKGRVPDARQDRYIRETIKRGELFGSVPPNSISDDFGIVQHFKFRRSFENWVCEIVIGTRPIANKRDDKKHLALTIYNPEDHK